MREPSSLGSQIEVARGDAQFALLSPYETHGDKAWVGGMDKDWSLDGAVVCVCARGANPPGDAVAWVPSESQLLNAGTLMDEVTTFVRWDDAKSVPFVRDREGRETTARQPMPQGYAYPARIAWCACEAGALIVVQALPLQDVTAQENARAKSEAGIAPPEPAPECDYFARSHGQTVAVAVAGGRIKHKLGVGEAGTSGPKRGAASIAKFFGSAPAQKATSATPRKTGSGPAPPKPAQPKLDPAQRLATRLFVAHHASLESRLPAYLYDSNNRQWWQMLPGCSWVRLPTGAQAVHEDINRRNLSIVAIVAGNGTADANFVPPVAVPVARSD